MVICEDSVIERNIMRVSVWSLSFEVVNISFSCC